MGTRSKLALAGAFVGVVVTAATAFGQTGSSSPGSSTSPTERPRAQKRAALAEKRADRCRAPRPRMTRRVVHSETKLKVPDGFANVTVDAGEITAIDHGDKTVTIKRLDGESVSATATNETKVCKDGDAVAFDSLKKGDVARLVSVRSEKFNGLRKIGAVTPGSAEGEAPARPARGASDDDTADLFDAVA
ncbi:MAG: hypothetical protein WAT66_16455 [Actinomycetota bacterium]